MKFFNPLGFDMFEVTLLFVEFLPYFASALAVLLFYSFSSPSTAVGIKRSIICFVPFSMIFIILSIVLCSWEDAYQNGYTIFIRPSLRSKLESYIETGKGGPLHDILESKKYAPTFGLYEVQYLFKDLIRHTLIHWDAHNEDNVHEGYNKGNDWFASMLGETMMYTSGLYPNGNESLSDAQNYKIDYVADAIQLKPGENVLDIGCGWGYLTKRLTEKYGANVTGVTLSEEQLHFGKELNANNGAKLLLQDAMKIKERNDLPPDGFDKITSLEMAEHVGIRRYQEFLTTVHSLLKDDGVFYFQVAGLRRTWRYEDLVWGLFMGENVFPGADASCPLGWVSTHLERAGFEVQRVHNMGNHYSQTLAQWLENWRSKEEYISQKYGVAAYRRWEVFLAWSVRVARQGSSTLFMFTLTKAGSEDRRIETQSHLVPKQLEWNFDE